MGSTFDATSLKVISLLAEKSKFFGQL